MESVLFCFPNYMCTKIGSKTDLSLESLFVIANPGRQFHPMLENSQLALAVRTLSAITATSDSTKILETENLYKGQSRDIVKLLKEKPDLLVKDDQALAIKIWNSSTDLEVLHQVYKTNRDLFKQDLENRIFEKVSSDSDLKLPGEEEELNYGPKFLNLAASYPDVFGFMTQLLTAYVIQTDFDLGLVKIVRGMFEKVHQISADPVALYPESLQHLVLLLLQEPQNDGILKYEIEKKWLQLARRLPDQANILALAFSPWLEKCSSDFFNCLNLFRI